MKKQPKTIRKRIKRPIPSKDLIGRRFGKWVVLEYAKNKFVHRTLLCRCDCGVQQYVDKYGLIKGRSKQCQRCYWDSNRIYFPKDLTGRRFGKWVVLEYVGKKLTNKIWLCRCDCGVQKHVQEYNLVRKRTTQCRQCRDNQTKRTESYLLWHRLKRSGLLSKKWQNYEIFSKAIGDPPSNKSQLQRYDKSKPHAPGNTYWADLTSQHVRKEFKEKLILGSPHLMRIRKAKTSDEMARCMIAAKEAGYEYEIIGLAAGISRQAAHQVIQRALEKLKHAGKSG
jgi:hypothetical protein